MLGKRFAESVVARLLPQCRKRLLLVGSPGREEACLRVFLSSMRMHLASLRRIRLNERVESG